MFLADRIQTYSVAVFQNTFLDNFRVMGLRLESGGTALIFFPKVRPTEWLTIDGATTSLYMTEDQFADVYHLIQTESPVFFTALRLFGGAGGVHTELELDSGETPGEGDEDPQSLEAMIRRARQEESHT